MPRGSKRVPKRRQKELPKGPQERFFEGPTLEKLIFSKSTPVSNGIATFEILQPPVRPNISASLPQTPSLSSLREACQNVHLHFVNVIALPVIRRPLGVNQASEILALLLLSSSPGPRFTSRGVPPPLPGLRDASWRLLATALLLTWLRSLQIDAILLPMTPQIEPLWTPKVSDLGIF